MRWGRTVLAIAVLSIGVCLVVPDSARAEKLPPQVLERFPDMIEAGEIEYIVDLLEDHEERQQVTDKSALLRRMAAATEKNAYTLARRSRDLAGRLVSELVSTANELITTRPKDADLRWMLAQASVASGRVTYASGDAVDSSPWIVAADALLEAHTLAPAGGVPLSTALEYLAQRGKHEGVDVAPLDEKIDSVLGVMRKLYPDAPATATATGSVCLMRSGRALATDKAAAQALLDEGIGALAPVVAGGTLHVEAATVHNDLVRFAGMNGLKTKAEFLTEERQVVRQLRYDLPQGARWRRSSDASSNQLIQLDENGKAVRSIDFDWYDWDSLYTIAGTETGGDNIKGLAKAGFEDWQSAFSKIRKKKGLSKDKLNKKLPAGQAFSVRGLDNDDDEYEVKMYYWKSKEGYLRTFRVIVYEWTEQSWEDDPAAARLLESVAELEKR